MPIVTGAQPGLPLITITDFLIDTAATIETDTLRIVIPGQTALKRSIYIDFETQTIAARATPLHAVSISGTWEPLGDLDTIVTTLDAGSTAPTVQKVIESLFLSPFLIEKYAREILSITSEELLSELQIFKSYLNSQQINTNWKPYSNLRENSTVLKYRIGADYIDVVFETCPTHFYHYNYKLTTILITEELKRLAKSGAYLGEHTRKMKQGMFIKCPLQNS